MPRDLTDKLTLVQIIIRCRHAKGNYLSQCWPKSLSSYGVTELKDTEQCYEGRVLLTYFNTEPTKCRGSDVKFFVSSWNLSLSSCQSIFIWREYSGCFSPSITILCDLVVQRRAVNQMLSYQILVNPSPPNPAHMHQWIGSALVQ